MSIVEEHCFVRQSATPRILEFVSHFCAECYREFSEGETLYYEMQNYRYLCEACADAYAKELDQACETVAAEDEELSGGLFD